VRFVAKHLDEFLIVGVVGEDALDGTKALESIFTNLFAEKYFGHTATGDLLR